MKTADVNRSIEFGDAATYRIVVQGTLTEASRSHFAEMHIEASGYETKSPLTMLLGRVRDQGALRAYWIRCTASTCR